MPEGRARLSAKDFKITARGLGRVTGQGVTVGDDQRVSREDLGRQATIAVTSTGPAAAVATLDALRRKTKGDKDKALRTGAFDPDALLRRIEGLAPSVLVDPEMRKDLYAMVGRAISAGRATSLAALTAFHLDEAGLLAADRAQHLTMGGARVPGLNWAGPGAVDLDLFGFERLKPDQTGGFEEAEPSSFTRGRGTTPLCRAGRGAARHGAGTAARRFDA
ncbi:hypothetical protein NKH77_28855 [Streptomyces sp. M19]